MGIFRRHLPEGKDILIVFSAILFAIFSWSIRGFLYILPSIAMRYALTEIIAIFSYMMAFAFIESFLVIGCILVASMLLPETWLRDGFSYKGFLIVLIGSIASILYQVFLGSELPELELYYLWAGILVILSVSLILLFHFVNRLQIALVSIAERFTVFAYLYIPVGFLGLVVVISRNLLSG